MISEAAESLGLSLLFFGALVGLFSFDACKVFLAGILPRDPAGLLPRLPRNSPLSYLYRFVVLSSAGLLLRILSCISSPHPPPPLPLFQLTPNAVISSSRGYVPLFVVQRCCDGGDGDGGGSSSSSSWWRRIPELRNSNEISGKVNILCVNQIPTSIRERVRIRGTVRLNSIVAQRLASFSWLYRSSIPPASFLYRMCLVFSSSSSSSSLALSPSFFLALIQYPILCKSSPYCRYSIASIYRLLNFCRARCNDARVIEPICIAEFNTAQPLKVLVVSNHRKARVRVLFSSITCDSVQL